MKITDQEIKLVVEIVRNAIRITEWFKKESEGIEPVLTEFVINKLKEY